MLGAVSVRVTAGHPDIPLRKIPVFVGSAMTVEVVDAPRTGNGVTIEAISVSVENAAGSVVSVAATRSGGVWTATIPASHFAAVGVVAMGVTISASGTDENGAARSWIIGKGDLTILPADGVPVPGETLQNVHLRDSVPATPTKGDLCEGANGWQIYTGDAWAVISPDLSDYATKADAALTARTGFSEWEYGALTASEPDWVWIYEQPQYSNGTWTTEITNGPDFETLTAQGGEDATSLTFTTASGAAVTASGSATRTALQGYQLGSQASKPLASEAEAEALRTGKQDALSTQQLTNIAAVPNKANDADVVHKTGNETIAGIKRFSGSLYVEDSSGNLLIMSKGFLWSTTGGDEPEILFPITSGTLALVSQLPASETWTFEVDDGQGGTTTVTKNVAVYAAGGNA